CALSERREDFSTEGLKSRDAADLKRTIVTPDLDQSLGHDRNALWCATFQLAWNEVRTLIAKDVHFDHDPPMVAALNAKRVTWADIDRASCVALAGWVRDGIIDQIHAQLEKSFHGAAMPRLVPQSNLRPQDIVAYAYLYKILEFSKRFERSDKPLNFEG